MYTPEIYRYQKISISQFRPGTSFGPKISWLVTYNSSSVFLDGFLFDIGTDFEIGIIVGAAVYFLLGFPGVGIGKHVAAHWDWILGLMLGKV